MAALTSCPSGWFSLTNGQVRIMRPPEPPPPSFHVVCASWCNNDPVPACPATVVLGVGVPGDPYPLCTINNADFGSGVTYFNGASICDCTIIGGTVCVDT